MDNVIPELFHKNLPFKQVATEHNDGRVYNVYEVSDPDSGRKEVFYFDVTPFFDRGGIFYNINNPDVPPPNAPMRLGDYFDVTPIHGDGGTVYRLSNLDFPLPNSPIKLGDFIASIRRCDIPEAHSNQMGFDQLTDCLEIANYPWEDKTKLIAWLNNTTITFNSYSPCHEGKVIARWNCSRDNINVIPFRHYLNAELPILHGYNFYKLFLFHQIIHISQLHNVGETEIEDIQGDKEACISFTPLPGFNFANDLINYTLWSHKQNAFDHSYELEAFAQTVKYGFRAGLFELSEVALAIKAANLAQALEEKLLNTIAIDKGSALRNSLLGSSSLPEPCHQSMSFLSQNPMIVTGSFRAFGEDQARN